MSDSPRKSFPVLKVLLAAAGLAYIYHPTFLWMVDRWNAGDSYYSHGFLIPVVTLYWIYRRREALLEPGRGPLILPVLSIAAGIGLQIAASMLRIYFVSAFSFVFVLFGAAGLVFGAGALKKIWFPIAFLFLMIPLPLLTIAEITVRMKFLVSQISVESVKALGIQAVREGSYIYTPHAVLQVGDPCSGLRSSLAFICLGFVFAYESRMPAWRRAVLVASAVPIAIFSNVLRVVALTLIGEIYGMQYTTGKVHDATGIGVFIVALALFMALRQVLEVRRAQA